MKLSAAVVYAGGGAAILSCQDGFKGVDAQIDDNFGVINQDSKYHTSSGYPSRDDWRVADVRMRRRNRKLEDGDSGVEGKVVVGNLDNTTTEHFVATNVTFPKGSLN